MFYNEKTFDDEQKIIHMVDFLFQLKFSRLKCNFCFKFQVFSGLLVIVVHYFNFYGYFLSFLSSNFFSLNSQFPGFSSISGFWKPCYKLL